MTPGTGSGPAPLRAAWIAFGVDLAGVVLAALFRIAQDVVGGGDFLEALGRAGIAGIDVRMAGFRELAKCTAYFIL